MNSTGSIIVVLMLTGTMGCYNQKRLIESPPRIVRVPENSNVSTLIRPGSTLTLPSIDWSRADNENVVLLVAPTCPACSKSAQAFRSVFNTDVRGRRSYQLITVTPTTAGKAEDTVKWLSSLSVQADVVIEAPIASFFGSGAYPVLFLIDRSGVVTNMWVGTMDPPHWAIVKRILQGEDIKDDPSSLPNTGYPAEVVEEHVIEMAFESAPVWLDVRDRAVVATSPRPGAYNIPADELETRLRHELPTDAAVLLDCTALDLIRCRFYGNVVLEQGFHNVHAVVRETSRVGDVAKAPD